MVIGVAIGIAVSTPGEKKADAPVATDTGTGAPQGSSDISPAQVACARNWQACEDNVALLNDSGWWDRIRDACQAVATQAAKFGTPIWPSDAFEGFIRGRSYIKTGKVIAIEPDAQFDNGFGAKAHVKVTCTYDLRRKEVTDIRTGERD